MSDEPRRRSSGAVPVAGDPGVALAPGSPDPEVYGPYLLLEQVGKGGMAEVFRAVRRGPENFVRMFALKRIIPQHADSTDFVAMFCTEARISALLNHPNIVQVYDFGEAQGSYYLAMEYLKGKTVLSVMRTLHARRSPFPLTTAAYVGREVALGLSYAHALRGADGKPLHLVHRDINPSNVMLLKSGGVKILDFGIAKVPALARIQTQAGYVKGKLSYSSPEQLKCKPLDGRSDVFSLGVMLWEMLTMQKLFGGKKDYDTVTNVMHKPLVPPSRLRDDVPRALDEIVMMALSRGPEGRPDAKEVADRLGDYLDDAKYVEAALVEMLRDLFGQQTSQVVAIPGAEALRGGPIPPQPAGLSDAQTQVMSEAELARLMADPAGERSSRVAAARVGHEPTVLQEQRRPAPERPRPRQRSLQAKVPTPMALSPEGPRPRRHVPTPVLAAAGVAGLAILLSANWSAFHQVATMMTSESAGAAGEPEALSSEGLEITVELDSKPPGATIERADGKVIGVTPVVLRLPRTSVPLVFFLKKPGHDPFRYEILPQRDSIATIELRSAKKR